MKIKSVVVCIVAILLCVAWWVIFEINKSAVDDVNISEKTVNRVTQMRAHAEIFRNEHGDSYAGVCSYFNEKFNGKEKIICVDSDNGYSVSAQVPGRNTYVCSNPQDTYEGINNLPLEFSCI